MPDVSFAPSGIAPLPIGGLLASEDFQALPIDDKIERVDTWLRDAEAAYTEPEDLAVLGQGRHRVYEALRIEEFNKAIRQTMPESLQASDEDYEAHRMAALQLYQSDKTGEPLPGSNPLRQLTEDSEIMKLAGDAMRGFPLPPLYPTDQEKVKQRVREMKGDVADFGLESDIVFGGPEYLDDFKGTPYEAENARRREEEMAAFRKSVDPALKLLEGVSEAKLRQARQKQWIHVDDDTGQFASNATLFSIRDSPHPTRDDLKEVRLGDKSVVVTDAIPDGATGTQVREFLAQHWDSFDNDQKRAIDAKFGTSDGFFIRGINALGRGLLAEPLSGVSNLLQGSARPEDENPGFWQKVGIRFGYGAEALKRGAPVASETVDLGEGFGFDSPQWWVDRGTEAVAQLGLQFASGGVAGSVAKGVGFGTRATNAARLVGFSSAAYLPQMGNIYRDAFDHHLSNGLKLEEAHDTARMEALAVGAATAGLETLSGHVLLGKKAATDAVATLVRRIVSGAGDAAIRGGVEGATELVQEISAIVGEAVVREDDSAITNEVAVLRDMMGGDMGAIRRSRAAAAGGLGAFAGFTATGARNIARQGPAVPSQQRAEAPSLFPEFEEEAPAAPLGNHTILRNSDGGYQLSVYDKLASTPPKTTEAGPVTVVEEAPEISIATDVFDFNTREEAEEFGRRVVERDDAREVLRDPDAPAEVRQAAELSIRNYDRDAKVQRADQRKATQLRSVGSFPTWIEARAEEKRLKAQMSTALPDADPEAATRYLEKIVSLFKSRIPALNKEFAALPDGHKAMAERMAALPKEDRARFAQAWALAANTQAPVETKIVDVTGTNGKTRYEVVLKQPTTIPLLSEANAGNSAQVIRAAVDDEVFRQIEYVSAAFDATAPTRPLTDIIGAKFRDSGYSAEESAAAIKAELDAMDDAKLFEDLETRLFSETAEQPRFAEGQPRADVPGNRQPQVKARKLSIDKARKLRRGEQGSTIIFDEIAKMAISAFRAGADFAKFSADAVLKFGEQALEYVKEVWGGLARTIGDQVTAALVNLTPARVQDEESVIPEQFRAGETAISPEGPVNGPESRSDGVSPLPGAGTAEVGQTRSDRTPQQIVADYMNAKRRAQSTERRTSPVEKQLREEREALTRDGTLTGTDEQFIKRMKREASRADRTMGFALKYIGVFSTEMGNIHPRLRGMARQLEFAVTSRRLRYATMAHDVLDGGRRMGAKKQAEFGRALSVGDYDAATRIAAENKFSPTAIQSLRDLLGIIHSEHSESRGDIGFIKNYFPRALRSYDHFQKYMNHVLGTELRGPIQKALSDAEKKRGGPLSPDEREHVVNVEILRLRSGRGRPRNLNPRIFDDVDEVMATFYKPWDEALTSYIDNAAKDIEFRRFFGQDAATGQVELNEAQGFRPNTSYGGLVAELLEKGEISYADEGRIRTLLNDRIGYKPLGRGLSTIKSIGYIGTIMNPIAATANLQDMAYTAYRSGYYSLGALPKAAAANLGEFLRRRKGKDVKIGDRLRAVDIGVTQAAVEFEDMGLLQKVLGGGIIAGHHFPGIGKISSFTYLDIIAKEGFVNAYLDSASKMSPEKFRAELSEIEGLLRTGPEQVQADIKSRKWTEDVKFLAFTKLSDFQPVSLAEMPVGYLRAEDGKLFYMLKGFPIKQLDVFRREAIQEIAKGNRAKGFGNLLFLTSAAVAAGAARDELVAFILGRDVKFGENVVNNLLKLTGVGKYSTDKAFAPIRNFWSDEKVDYETFGQATGFILGIPQISMMSKLMKDVDTLGDAIREDKPIGPALSNASILEMLPIAGKLYYWQWGGGVEREHKKFMESEQKDYAPLLAASKARHKKLKEKGEDGRSKAEDDEYSRLNKFYAPKGLRTHYEKIMRKAIAEGDPNTMDSAKRRISYLAEHPEEWQKEHDKVYPDKPRPRARRTLY